MPVRRLVTMAFTSKSPIPLITLYNEVKQTYVINNWNNTTVKYVDAH